MTFHLLILRALKRALATLAPSDERLAPVVLGTAPHKAGTFHHGTGLQVAELCRYAKRRELALSHQEEG